MSEESSELYLACLRKTIPSAFEETSVVLMNVECSPEKGSTRTSPDKLFLQKSQVCPEKGSSCVKIRCQAFASKIKNQDKVLLVINFCFQLRY